MELPFLAWTDEYAIGHAELDAEHRQLVETINEICSIAYAGYTPDQIKPLLEALTIATVQHFKHENTLIREVSHWVTHLQENQRAIHSAMSASAVNEHCAEHARALLRLELIIHAFYFEVDSNRGKFGKTLIDWFTEHALKHDADLRDVLRVYFAETNAAVANNKRINPARASAKSGSPKNTSRQWMIVVNPSPRGNSAQR